MTLTTPMKVVLAVIIIAIIGLGFWMLDWQGKQQQLAQMDRTIEDKHKQKEEVENNLKQVDELVKRSNDLKRQLEEVVKTGFTPESEKEFVPNYLSKIEQMVAQVRAQDGDPSFELVTLTPGAQQTTQSGAAPSGKEAAKGSSATAPPPVAMALQSYPTRTFQMTMKGRYETIIDFLDRLGRLEMERLVTVNRISLSPQGKEGESPVLTITLPLTAYLRQGGGAQ